MQLVVRHSLAATVSLAAVGVIAVTPGVTSPGTPGTPSRVEVRSPAVQVTGDSSVFLPLPAGDTGFDQSFFDGLLTVDRDLISTQGDIAGQMVDGLNGANAILHETDFIADPVTNLFNANGIAIDASDVSTLLAPQLNFDPSTFNGSFNGSSLGASDGAGSQAASLAAVQSPFFSADLANAVSAVAADIAQLQASVMTLGTDLVSAGEDFSSNFVLQTEAIAAALQDFNSAAFATALQNLIDTAAFEAVLAQDLPAVFQDMVAFGNVMALGQLLGTALLLGI